MHLSIGGALAQYVHVDADGVLWLRAAALPSNTTRMHLIATATDTGVPPRSSSVPVTVLVGAVGGGADAEANGGRDGMLLSARRGGWAEMGDGLMGTLGVVLVATMVVIIVAMAVYIYGQTRRRAARNRVHSSSSGASDQQLGNEQRLSGASTAAPGSGKSAAGRLQSLGHGGGVGANIRLVTPLHGGMNNNNINGDGGSGGLMMGGANAVLAANLDRDAQRQREKDNYTATVRSECFYIECVENICWRKSPVMLLVSCVLVMLEYQYMCPIYGTSFNVSYDKTVSNNI